MKLMNIDLIPYKKCCGCELCATICPQEIIEMKADDAGFLYPQIINKDKCANCGRCLSCCPIKSENIPDKIESRISELYFWVRNEKELLSSSSGGLASHLYRTLLADGAYIVGVEYTADYTGAQYAISKDFSKVEKFKGSKYVQARKHRIYQEIKQVLSRGNKVLFIGLPCEVAALKMYTDSDNLYTCELICHGPTSSDVFSNYIAYLEKRSGSRVVYYTSRFKNLHWKPVCSLTVYSDGTKQVQEFAATELGKAFQIVKRYSCYNCAYKNGVTLSDLTIGDFHAANLSRGEYNRNGVSICLVNTAKGEFLIEKLADDEVVIGVADHFAAMANRALVESLPKLPGRERFIRIMKRDGIDVACHDMFIRLVLKSRRYPYRVKLMLRKLLRKIWFSNSVGF